MIDYMKGTLIAKLMDQVVLEVNGIGYIVHVSKFLIDSLPEINKEIKLFISETNSMYSGSNSFYGFISSDEKILFETIKTVNKIGAKGALDILSRIGAKTHEFRNLIINADIEKLHEVFGFTLQKAEKLVLGLKNKIDKTTDFNFNIVHGVDILSTNDMNERDAVEALKTLGYTSITAKKVVTDILKTNKIIDISIEDIIKLALKKL